MNDLSGRIRPQTVDAALRRPYAYSSSMVPGFALIVDAAAIVAAGAATSLALADSAPETREIHAFAIALIGLTILGLGNFARLYTVGAVMRPMAVSDHILACITSAFLFFAAVLVAFRGTESVSFTWIYAFAGAATVALYAGRVALCRVLRHLSRRKVLGRSLVVLGAGEQGKRFLGRISRVNPYLTTVLGVYDRDAGVIGPEVDGFPVLGDIDALIRAARRAEIDDVVVAMPWSQDQEVCAAVETLRELPVNVFISSDLAGFQLAFRPAPGPLRQLPLFEVVQRPISGWSSVLKRIEDYVLASVALVMLSPLMLLVAIAIKLESRGPVFFRQPRLGFNNQRFDIFKFRSMYHGRPETEVRQATKNDPRVTRVGRFIRRTSIDELPQLLNVLNGTMSLVGPRPHALSHNEDFARQVRGYFARHRVRPGISGWAQVNGLRGETDTLAKIQARVEYDIHYAENWSLAFDLRILVMTALVVLFQKSAY